MPVLSGTVSFGDTLYVGPFSFYVRLFSNLHRRTAQQKKVILKHFARNQVYTKMLNICKSSTINYYFLIYTYDFRSCIFGLSKRFQTYCWKIVYERESMLRVGVISSSGGVHVLINNQQSTIGKYQQISLFLISLHINQG